MQNFLGYVIYKEKKKIKKQGESKSMREKKNSIHFHAFIGHFPRIYDNNIELHFAFFDVSKM